MDFLVIVGCAVVGWILGAKPPSWTRALPPSEKPKACSGRVYSNAWNRYESCPGKAAHDTCGAGLCMHCHVEVCLNGGKLETPRCVPLWTKTGGT